MTIEARRSDVLADHRIRSNARAINSGVITAVIAARGMHLKRWIAIIQRRSNAFYNAYQQPHPDRRSRSNGHDIFEAVHGGPFHRNGRSF